MGLWSIWLSGFALIALSFYSIQRLPPIIDQKTKSTLSQKGSRDMGNPKVTIFSAPSPFTGSVAARQSLAVRSWLALSSQITVVLFSQHPSVFSFAEAFGSRVWLNPTLILRKFIAYSFSFAALVDQLHMSFRLK